MSSNNRDLVLIIEQMIKDKVKLIHGGQVIEWEETKIPDLITKLKKELELNSKYLFEDNDN